MRWCTTVDKYQVCCSKAIAHADDRIIIMHCRRTSKWTDSLKVLIPRTLEARQALSWAFPGAHLFFSIRKLFPTHRFFFWRRWAFPGVSPRAASSQADNFAFQSLQCDKKLRYEQALGWIFKQRNLDMFEDIKLRLGHFGTGWRDSMLVLSFFMTYHTVWYYQCNFKEKHHYIHLFCRSN